MSSIVFTADTEHRITSAYIKADIAPIIKSLCDKYSVLEPSCDRIECRADGSVWVKDSEVEAFWQHCNTDLNSADHQEKDGFQWEWLANVAHGR